MAASISTTHACKRDARRDDVSARRKGFRVLRFNNHDVMTNRARRRWTSIAAAVGEAAAPSLPSPASGGGSQRCGACEGERAMKFTLAWLKEHLDTDAPLDDIVDKLTMIGLEVETRRGQGQAARALRHRHGGRGEAASERRPAARLHGRYRRRQADPGGVRRAERAHRHDRRVRAARRLHSRQEHHARRSAPSAASRAAACWCRNSSCKSPTITTASSTCPPTRRSARNYAK